jgi:hypothetical protein
MLVITTEVLGSSVLPSLAAADDSGEERVVAETAVSQMVSEPQVGTISGDDDVVMVSAERVVPPPPPSRDHEVVASAATETPTPMTAPAGGGTAEASASGA